MDFRLYRRKTGRNTEVWQMAFHIQVIDGGKRHSKEIRESTGIAVDLTTPKTIEATRKKAHGWCLAKLSEIEGKGYALHKAEQTVTISSLLDTYLNFRIRKNPSGMKYATRFLRNAFGPALAHEFSYLDFLAWRDRMAAAGYKHNSIDKITRIFRAAFHLGQQLGLVSRCPMLPCYGEDDARQGFMEHPEFLALHNALDRMCPPLARHFAFDYYCGCRPSEAEGLTWDNVSIETHSVTFVDTKTADSRTVSLPQMWAVIEECQRHRTHDGVIVPWVFHVDGEPFDANYRNSLFRKAVKAAGVEKRIWYDLRRTFYRNCINAGVPEVTVMSITGHKTRAMAKRYAIRSLSDQWAAGKLLESELDQQTTLRGDLLAIASADSVRTVAG